MIYVLRAQIAPAIDAFHRVCNIKVTNEDDRRVVELARLAIGRLCTTSKISSNGAIEAYQAVPRTSPLFDTALYEIAWVYIRMGDSTRAERALEVLSVAVPDSTHIPDGKLLRGNLLLRDGRFDDSTQVFEEVSGQFGPVREELDHMLAQHEDATAYFRQLVRDNLDVFDVSAFLPPRGAALGEHRGRDAARDGRAVGSADGAPAGRRDREHHHAPERRAVVAEPGGGIPRPARSPRAHDRRCATALAARAQGPDRDRGARHQAVQQRRARAGARAAPRARAQPGRQCRPSKRTSQKRQLAS